MPSHILMLRNPPNKATHVALIEMIYIRKTPMSRAADNAVVGGYPKGLLLVKLTEWNL